MVNNEIEAGRKNGSPSHPGNLQKEKKKKSIQNLNELFCQNIL